MAFTGREFQRVSCCLILGALLAIQTGAGAQTPLERAKALAMRPVPSVPHRELPPSDMVWVPDRYVRIPGEPGEARVPAHWERRISDNEFYVPPLILQNPSTGTSRAVPHGVRGPAELRHWP